MNHPVYFLTNITRTWVR